MNQKQNIYTLYVDGASRNNPGKAGAGVVLFKNNTMIAQFGYYIGVKTNNQAEYAALLLGLFHLKQYITKDDTLLIVSDSQLLVRQIKGLYQVRNLELLPLFQLAHTMLASISYDITHVLRDNNILADMLANKGIDAHEPMPIAFIELLAAHNIAW